MQGSPVPVPVLLPVLPRTPTCTLRLLDEPRRGQILLNPQDLLHPGAHSCMHAPAPPLSHPVRLGVCRASTERREAITITDSRTTSAVQPRLLLAEAGPGSGLAPVC